MEAYKTEDKPKIKYDGSIAIATGKSRKETHWKNKNILWSELVDKLSNTTRTPETYAEYKKMAKTEKDRIKDVGGFVGGGLKNGRRKAENVQNRTLLTLDLDYVSGDIWSSIELLWDFSVSMYSTHTHAVDNQRLRLVIPLSRPVLPDEYQAISRMVASDLGIDQFDDTTYEPSRLMYWPSTSSDGDYIFKIQDEPWLNPDEILARYTFGWQDVSYWPESSRARAKLNNAIKKQEDPLKKKGIIGAFCRTYTITEAIAEFLNDIYVPGVDETRYTYAEGSTTGGVVVYENKFSYSHHGTDPASNILCNAFDLVRIHKFGHLDDEVRIDTKQNNLPSFKKMTEVAINDNKVKMQLGKDRLDLVKDEFDVVEIEEDNNDWLAKLEYTQQGKVKSTVDNVKIIMENDIRLKDKLAYNEFNLRDTIKGKLPWDNENKIRFWTDDDDSGLRHYLGKAYDILRATQVINDATRLIFKQNKFHPVKDYLNSLIWDGEERVETVLIDYFGVEDNVYARAASRIFICGAVARIFNPGCQLDYVTTIVGKQGIRKGTFYRYMAKKDDWYTELATIKYKEAIEETMGKWIVEMAEMAPTKKSEIEEMKAFITNKSKTIRMAYARNPIDIPRQYVLVASTNEPTFLKDPTGDRRYLPVDADMTKATKSIVKDLRNEVDQIYAEAVILYKKLKNKALMLNTEEEALASIEQDNHRIVDDEESTIIEFLETPLPKDWYEKDLYERQRYFNDSLSSKATKEDGIIRDRVCVKEILNELYCVTGKVDLRDSARINKILQGLKSWEKQKNVIRINGYGRQRGYYRV
ncbi:MULTISPECIES: virulence-associated E family protein [Clostridium]|uniref:virulence-associated E family protein n=1 Tax=Clostridium TaxID=1485 RepID=UPI000698E0AB|nr:virulence-associated E family protein [Clostridium sporogenes]STC84068.1 virulence-associated E domain-containing protein [Clostridium botulinum]MCW6061594.1 virulence-associated E family protein [Clostridium sporogenes]MCW6069786.1 virulence-associated E family protein [Clostridium sporogenes]MCW6085537.1 virulence-associated E family protein [Clostridium sporogenes]MCW6122516.1 virulence-associated E family protein [Clostridium sporogenes]